MSRQVMVSTIFLKNRLERLLKPIDGKLAPSFVIETRQENWVLHSFDTGGEPFARDAKGD